MPVINMVVVHDDGSELDVKAGPKQQIAFERHHKKGLGSALTGDNMHVADLYWLAWKSEVDHNAKHGGSPVPLFDVWIDTLEDVRLGEDDDGPLSL